MFDLDMIKGVYARMADQNKIAQSILNRPMTLSEKVLYSHLFDGKPTEAFGRG